MSEPIFHPPRAALPAFPTESRVPMRSAFFGRSEITRRCHDLLREEGETTADDVTVRAMREKG